MGMNWTAMRAFITSAFQRPGKLMHQERRAEVGFSVQKDAAKIFTSVSGSEMADIVREMGFLPELTVDKGEIP